MTQDATLYRMHQALGIAGAQVQNFKPVTRRMLANPSPNDWLSFSRTYDDQRYSP